MTTPGKTSTRLFCKHVLIIMLHLCTPMKVELETRVYNNLARFSKLLHLGHKVINRIYAWLLHTLQGYIPYSVLLIKL